MKKIRTLLYVVLLITGFNAQAHTTSSNTSPNTTISGVQSPVLINDFSAEYINDHVVLNWATSEETNFDHFTVERSDDANNWQAVGNVISKYSAGTTYNFSDGSLLDNAVYYRLQIVDKDGKTTYSNTVLVKMNNDKIITVVYPNPAKDILHVETNSSATFSLIDQSGKILLMTTNINGKGVINISGVAAGVYYLKNNSTGDVQKVIIAR